MPLTPYKAIFDELYSRYTRPGFMTPDPVTFLHEYDHMRDREIVGLVASCLAYGRAAQISKSVAWVLGRMPSPARLLSGATARGLTRAFAGFRHRFTDADDLVEMLLGAKRAVELYGSLQACFAAGLDRSEQTVARAIERFVQELTRGRPSYLLPSPARGSACKRLNLFLRWMVRQDEVDLGGWHEAPRSKLIIPLDTHMHKIGLALKATKRKQADLRTALEITAAFRTIAPEDPVRYDFALTRLGIRADADVEAFLRQCRASRRESHA